MHYSAVKYNDCSSVQCVQCIDCVRVCDVCSCPPKIMHVYFMCSCAMCVLRHVCIHRVHEIHGICVYTIFMCSSVFCTISPPSNSVFSVLHVFPVQSVFLDMCVYIEYMKDVGSID